MNLLVVLLTKVKMFLLCTEPVSSVCIIKSAEVLHCSIVGVCCYLSICTVFLTD